LRQIQFEMTGRSHLITVSVPRDGLWDQVREHASALDSTGDNMRQALDALEGRRHDNFTE